MKKIQIISIILACTLLLASCTKSKQETKPQVLSVSPNTSIQKVIDKAHSGDMILIEPGTYKGNIVVSTPDLTIRGKDRNKVIIDGNYEQENGIIVANDGVRIENLTVQKFQTNGILFQGGYTSDNSTQKTKDVLYKYSISYVNVLNNGLYGIYAFSSRDGEIHNTYSKANADAGIYVGQCKPCNTLAYNNTAEDNGIGLQGANASRDFYVYSNDFSKNRTGIHILSETKEFFSPQEAVKIVANIVNENNATDAPTATPNLFGFGIIIAGGQNNIVEKNRTDTNAQVGLALVENGEFLPKNNTFKSNDSKGNGFPVGFDMAYIIKGRPDVMSLGNCFENNSYSSSSIDRIQEVLPCTNAAPGPFASQGFKTFTIPPAKTFSDIPVDVQERKNIPTKINQIPKPLKKITLPDLSDLTLPN